MIGTLDGDRHFALTHAPRAIQPSLRAVWALDLMLGDVVRTTTQPMVGQMRLTWWHDVISTLLAGVSPAQPELQALVEHVIVPGLVPATDIVPLVEGWEALLDPLPLAEGPLEDYARGRGDRLFAVSGVLLGKDVAPGAGAGWALADFGARCSDEVTSRRALAMARDRLARADLRVLPRPLRILARLARMDAIAGRRVSRNPLNLLRSVR